MSSSFGDAFDPIGLEQTLFPVNSRYHAKRTQSISNGDDEVVYLERRFIPLPESLGEMQVHTVVDGERSDLLAYQYYGDPEQFWRIADGNLRLDPALLTAESGVKLRITLPQGLGDI